MIKRIVLENYMSHARTVIEPADGLTVLVGPNNCGKSAVVSALQTLCYNRVGDFMVRHGAKESSVTVETGDGHTLAWRRKGKVVSYVVDGREVYRLQRAPPEDLHEHLRLPRVKSADGSDEFDIHFGEQKAPIFLLNDPDSRAATFFASSSDAEKLLEMQRRHREQVAAAKADAKRLGKEIESIDQVLTFLAPVPDVARAAAAADAEQAAGAPGSTGKKRCAAGWRRGTSGSTNGTAAASGSWRPKGWCSRLRWGTRRPSPPPCRGWPTPAGAGCARRDAPRP